MLRVFPQLYLFSLCVCFPLFSVPGAEIVLLMIDLFVKLEAYLPELQQPLQQLLQVTMKSFEFDIGAFHMGIETGLDLKCPERTLRSTGSFQLWIWIA